MSSCTAVLFFFVHASLERGRKTLGCINCIKFLLRPMHAGSQSNTRDMSNSPVLSNPRCFDCEAYHGPRSHKPQSLPLFRPCDRHISDVFKQESQIYAFWGRPRTRSHAPAARLCINYLVCDVTRTECGTHAQKSLILTRRAHLNL